MKLDSFDPDPDQSPVLIPWQHLSTEALAGVVEACLVAQVADQNVEGFDLKREVTKVLAGLDAGDWALVYDPVTESPALLPADELPAQP
ncbi:YheU family protein [Natronospirillum operosum]|nr:YheU family protein [Natronospirillum operosum]